MPSLETRAFLREPAMSDEVHDRVVARMAERAKHCRRLAASVDDRATRATLLHMAEEMERDVKRLVSAGRDSASC